MTRNHKIAIAAAVLVGGVLLYRRKAHAAKRPPTDQLLDPYPDDNGTIQIIDVIRDSDGASSGPGDVFSTEEPH